VIGLDPSNRHVRRELARRRIRRQRLLAAAVVLLVPAGGGLALGYTLAQRAGSSDSVANTRSAQAELPRGGRRIFPRFRVVAFYGAPQDAELGALGVGSPHDAGRRLARQARSYRRGGRPVLPAFELIATTVHSAAGADGDYSQRQTGRTIGRYLRAARRRRALLILDLQPGRAPFMREVRAFRRFLREPDVSLALDPEWSMGAGEVPGREIGSTDAATVNEVSRYLSSIVRRHRLPQKLLVVHRFTSDMISDEHRLERHRGVALTVNVDGFGDRPNKISKYHQFTRGRSDRHHGFKLFYREDTDLMRPRDVLRLRPRPELVVYE
jgi:hypothetical protein